MIETILVALDGSERSDQALSLAGDMALKYNARVVLVHTLLHAASISELEDIAERYGFSEQIKKDFDDIDIVPVLMDVIGSERALLYVPVAVLRIVGKLYIEKAASHLAEKGLSNIKTYVVGGEPAPEILHYAQSEDADLIVMGSRGLGDVKSLMLGSVSHKVLQQSKCPCLLTK